ncbi:uncharacterized protein LAESUDRAFT_764272 [Laetiporus sulphureus 93-53]|uniref:Uncharacterized protein n=1 Tax=Laetiporus sulphureus 93-53 TaxID=1314785 RepID=A0A165BDP9_9APHY|nr:uncharacterized protein LAESUDRAFT_764272 [Laetiporus sulphureus 93-53]KZT00817.1 hypothetical protein LAESUDRAFT_764272 [Laetiporus sulphureus 93-53]
MYSAQPPAEFSNNPFIDHPANALSRYPDITGDDDPTSGQYTSWLNKPSGSSPAPNPTGYPGQGLPTGYNGGLQQPQMQPQQTGWTGGGGYTQPQQGYGVPAVQSPQMTGRPGFQPSSSFGQQLAAQVNGPGAYTGMPQQQQQQQQPPQQQYTDYPSQFGANTGYQPAYYPQPQQQPQQQGAPYLAEFDPYAQAGQAFGQQNSSAGTGGYRPPHPREYVQQHKVELDSWDVYAWKQAQNCFEALREAWGARKREVEARGRSLGGAGLFGGGGYGGMYGGQAQEMARLESLAKEAESNHDSVAASAFQFQEVFSGYRQSGDLASKRRVREAINAALTSLPDWPSQTF